MYTLPLGPGSSKGSYKPELSTVASWRFTKISVRPSIAEPAKVRSVKIVNQRDSWPVVIPDVTGKNR